MVQVANYELLNECQWAKKYPKEGILREKEGTDSEGIRTRKRATIQNEMNWELGVSKSNRTEPN